MIRAVIFDCFGVIIVDVLRPVVAELKLSNPSAATEVANIIQARNRGYMDAHESNQRIAEILGMSIKAWRDYIDQRAVKDEQLLAYIRDLRRRGYKTALLSNIGRESLQPRFTGDELQTHFDAVVASGEVGMVKPEPEIYLHAAEKLGVTPSECVFTDDHETHCVGAKAVGMQTVWYQDFPQAKRELEQLLGGNQG